MLLDRVKRRGPFANFRMIPAILLGAALLMQVEVASAASFRGIGAIEPPPGETFSSTSVSGVSADGTWLVGQAQVGLGSGTLRLLRWSEATGLEGLGPAVGRAISDDGSVIVGRGSGGAAGSGAIRYTDATGIVDLGTLGGGGVRTAQDVSSDGSVVVGYSGNAAFRWTQATGITALPGVNGQNFNQANAVSADGSIAVGQSNGTVALWDDAGVVRDLGRLPGTFIGEALGVSADGATVVGWSGTGGPAFRWTEANGMEALGTAAPDETEARAVDVSADGSVIVGSLVLGDVFSGGELVAAIWDPVNGQRILSEVLAPDVDLTGWELTQATGVSDDGLTIVGTGRNPNGRMEGWIAVIPEPSTGLLLALGLGGLAGNRRGTMRGA